MLHKADEILASVCLLRIERILVCTGYDHPLRLTSVDQVYHLYRNAQWTSVFAGVHKECEILVWPEIELEKVVIR